MRSEREREREREAEEEEGSKQSTRPPHPNPPPAPPPPPSPPSSQAPKHLTGTLPGDRGFDPLGLGAAGPDRLKWYVEAEKTNARWAMIAVAGCLGQELLGKGKWFEAGAQSYAIPTLGLFAIQQVLFGFLELNRFQAYKGEKNALFPLDPAGMNSETNAVKELKVRRERGGRGGGTR